MSYSYVKTKNYGSFIEFLNDNDITFEEKVAYIHQDLQDGCISLEMFEEFIEHTKITNPVKSKDCCYCSEKSPCHCN